MTRTEIPQRPIDTLMTLIVSLLAPMFLGLTNGDISQARAAAAQMVNAHCARDQADLIAVAQIIAFGIAAVGSLSLSMADDISVSLALRLRSNANACQRSAEQNRRALQAFHPQATNPQESCDDTAPPETSETEPFLSAAAQTLLAAESAARLRDQDPGSAAIRQKPARQKPAREEPARDTPARHEQTRKRDQEMWAIVMMKAAADLTKSIPSLPPEQRRAAEIKAASLSGAASAVIYRQTPPDFDPRVLLGITEP